MIRSSLRRQLLGSALLVLIAGAVSSVWGQGDLVPPGPPAPSMRRLDEIEARSPVNALNTPGNGTSFYRITNSGSYYLTGKLYTADRAIGIEITARDVVLDMNGFCVQGETGDFGTVGIRISGSGVVVRGGSIRGWATGLKATGSDVEAQGLMVTDSKDYGIQISSGRVRDCTVRTHAIQGIHATDVAEIRDCRVSGAGSGIKIYGGSIKNCRTWGGMRGIQIDSRGTVEDCEVSGTESVAFSLWRHSLVRNCTAVDNEGGGFSVDSGCTLENCKATDNRMTGISTAEKCVIRNCIAISNNGTTNSIGIIASDRCLVSGCTALENGRDGIVVAGDSRVENCHASKNGMMTPAAGIRTMGSGSRISGNHTRDNFGTGILAGFGDLVFGNASGANSVVQFSPRSGNNFGPVQAPAATTNPLANIEF